MTGGGKNAARMNMRLQWPRSSVLEALRAVRLPASSRPKPQSPRRIAPRCKTMRRHAKGPGSEETPLGGNGLGIWRLGTSGPIAFCSISGRNVVDTRTAPQYRAMGGRSQTRGRDGGATWRDLSRRGLPPLPALRRGFFAWRLAFETSGVIGLRATCVQRYRGASFFRPTQAGIVDRDFN